MNHLELGALQQVGGGAPRSLWSLSTAEPLVALLDPRFLGRHYARSVIVGDLIVFACGENLHGIAVVSSVFQGAGESSGSGAVGLRLLATSGASAAKLKAVR